jgi:DNA-binding NarL/FixJ family response regulator
MTPVATLLANGKAADSSPGAAGPIAIVDRNDVYARGLRAALEDEGFAVARATDDLDLEDVGLVLLSIRSTDDWDTLAELESDSSDVVVVAVLPEPGLQAYIRALGLGARAIVAEDAPVGELVEVVRAALRNLTLVPSDIARTLASGPSEAEIGSPITNEEADWLRALARGTTVAQLAEASSYSEREMHRLLRRLYLRMDARNRSEALVVATRLGLLS